MPLRLWFLITLWRTIDSLRDESTSVFDAYSGGDLIDIGAFHGWYSVLLAPKANSGDRFVSLEPDPAAFRELLVNLSSLSETFHALRVCALGDAAGDGQYIDVQHPPGGHPAFHSREIGHGHRTVTVDGLVETLGLAPTFVKIDVEGAEWFVLTGMRRTLTQFAPTVMLEVHSSWQPPGVDVEQLYAFLNGLGYALSRPDEKHEIQRQIWRKAS